MVLENKPFDSYLLGAPWVQSALRSQDATEKWFSDSFSKKPGAAGPDKAPDRCWMGEHRSRVGVGWRMFRIQGFKDVVSLERVGESLERPKRKSHFIIVGRGAWDMRGQPTALREGLPGTELRLEDRPG